MDLLKVEEEAKEIYKSLKSVRGAFREGAAIQIDEHYKLIVGQGFKDIHIAHGSKVVISVSDNAFSLRLEEGESKEFDGMKFLNEFKEVIDEKADEMLDAHNNFEELLIKNLEEQLKKLKAKRKK